MAKITSITSREILDAKGNPTVETTVILDDGTQGIASTPNGTSVGSHEAIDFRDNDSKRYHGLGVLKAIQNVQSVIAVKLIGRELTDPRLLDEEIIALDGTENKGRLGANAMLSVSVALFKAASASKHIPLYLYIKLLRKDTSETHMPTPTFNVINGGKHASNKLDFQEFLAIPVKDIPYREKLQMGVAIYKALFDLFTAEGLPTLVGDEGGFGPATVTNAK